MARAIPLRAILFHENLRGKAFVDVVDSALLCRLSFVSKKKEKGRKRRRRKNADRRRDRETDRETEGHTRSKKFPNLTRNKRRAKRK